MVPGGYTPNGTPTSVVEVYDPATDSWSSRDSAARRRCLPMRWRSMRARCICSAGRMGAAIWVRSLVYDPAADRWTAHAPMPTPRGFAAAATLDKAIYVVGGYDGRREFATCERYWPDRDAWESCAPLDRRTRRIGAGRPSSGGCMPLAAAGRGIWPLESATTRRRMPGRPSRRRWRASGATWR